MNVHEDNWKKKVAFFLTAQTVSLFGSSLVQYAIIWYITLTTSSGTMMTISVICGFLPQITIAVFAGVWIDRYNRKFIIMIFDAIIAVATLALAILFSIGYQSVWLLFVVLAIRSVGTGVQTPTINAVIPQLTPKRHLMRINGINSSLNSLIMFISPAASGALYAMISIEKIFFIDVITAVIGISIMSLIKIPRHKNEAIKTQSNYEVVRQGFIYIRKNSFIKSLLVFLIVVLLLSSPSAFLTPLMVSRSFGPEAWRLAVNEMTYSAGAAFGGMLIAIWGGFNDRLRTTALSCVAYGICVIMLGVMPSFWLYLIFNFLIGITLPYFNAPVTVLLQEKIEPDMYGRVFSLLQAVYSSALPLGMLLFGPLADKVEIESILIVTGILGMSYGLYVFSNKPFAK